MRICFMNNRSLISLGYAVLFPILTSAEAINLDIGTLPAGASITLTFDVTLNSPLPPTVTQVATQGIVSGSNFATLLTDDPDTLTPNDPTLTQVDQPPVAICHDVMVTADAGCVADVTAGQVDNGSYDPDSGSVIVSLTPAGPYPLGMTSVILSVTDDELDSASCTAWITVIDNTPPFLACQNIVLPLDASGEATIVPSDLITNASDNCATLNYFLSQDSFTCSHLGTNPVMVTAQDGSANTSVCDATVIVVDNLAPTVLIPPLGFLVANASGEASIPSVTEIAIASDNCTSASFLLITQSPLAGELVGLGTAEIVVSATDMSGNVGSATAILAVLTPTPTMTFTPTSSPTPTETPTLEDPTPTDTSTPEEPTATPTDTATPDGPTPTFSETITPEEPTVTETPNSATPTFTSTETPTFTPTDTITPGGPTLTFTPTETPTGPTPTVTETPFVLACDSGYYVLDSMGGRHRVGNPIRITGSLYFGNDIARDMERAVAKVASTTNEDLVVLDGAGSVQFVMTPAANIPQMFYFGDALVSFPQGRALDLEMSVDSEGFWVLTDFGGIFRAGSVLNGDPPMVPNTDRLGLGWDVPIGPELRDPGLAAPGGATLRAVSLVVIDEDENSMADGYVIIDSMGGHYQFDNDGNEFPPGASTGSPENSPRRLLDPSAYVWPFFAGLDIARDAERHSTQQGLVIFDGWGGIHPVPVDIPANPVFFANNRDPQNPAELITTVGMPYVTAGFIPPGTLGGEAIESDAASIFEDLEFSAGCGDGFYTMDKFGGVFVFGAARPEPDNLMPPFFGSPYFFPNQFAESLVLFAGNETEFETDF